MKSRTKGSIVFVLSLVLLTACSSANPPVANSTNAPESGQPVAEGGAPQAGSNQIVIAGAQNITYTPIAQGVSNIGGQLEIFLQLQTDNPNQPSGVRIFVPEGTGVGSYDMVNLLDLEDGVSARFDYSNAGVLDYFEGTDGHLELIEAMDTYSGSFTFNAVDPRDQSRFIAVSGNFDGAVFAQ